MKFNKGKTLKLRKKIFFCLIYEKIKKKKWEIWL